MPKPPTKKSPTPAATYTIGALSKRTGVPVKTIRYYSDEGLLPPAEVSAAGYRRYTTNDLARLETIRTLRAAGFDLATIGRLLGGETDARQAIELQIAALAGHERLLRRQRRVLERALHHGDLDRYPDRVRALALLSAGERSSFLRRHLEDGLDGLPIDPVWLSGFLDAAAEDLPDDLTDTQLDAWTELAAMVADPTFAEAMRQNAEPFWSGVAAGGRFEREAYQGAMARITEAARAAMRAGHGPESEAAQRVAGEWIATTATVMGRANDAAFAHWMTDHGRKHDPRLARYWELVGILKGWPVDAEAAGVWAWLSAALEHRAFAGTVANS